MRKGVADEDYVKTLVEEQGYNKVDVIGKYVSVFTTQVYCPFCGCKHTYLGEGWQICGTFGCFTLMNVRAHIDKTNTTAKG